MSDNRSWKNKYLSYDEDAIDLVRRCVRSLRRTGYDSERALRELAPALSATTTRIRKLFYRDGQPVVMLEELIRMRKRSAEFFYRQRDRHLILAAQDEAEAEAAESIDQLSFCWETTWDTNAGPRGPIASGHR